MSLPERREPDGVSCHQESQTQAQSTAITTCVAVQTNLSSFNDDADELCHDLSESSSSDDSKIQDIPVCLQHQGQQGGSPVLITLPFQNRDTLQTFVPCGMCHHPGINRSQTSTPTDAVAFCVCEVNIQTTQLTLVPCFLCWQPNGDLEVPTKITVPLFPTLQPGGTSEPEVRFVPCALCLQPEHCCPISAGPASEAADAEEESVASTTEDIYNLSLGCTSWFVPFNNLGRFSNTSLQMAFILRCGNIIRRSRQRQREIFARAKARQNKVLFAQNRRSAKYLRNRSQKTSTVIKQSRNFISVVRNPMNFTHKGMREQTERIYKTLPEVKESQKQQLKEQLQQTHKLMAYIFQKRLQRATLQGKVSWQITESCM